jgi:allantoin racemase
VRILVVNSNTSTFVTEKLTAEARLIASPETEIVAVTGTFGGRVIGTRSENAIAEYATLSLITEYAPGFDGILIAVSYDTCLRAARELLSIPVVGMTEAALLTACMAGGKIGVVVLGRRVLPMYQEQVASYGLNERIAGWRAIESSSPFTLDDQTELNALLVSSINSLVEEDFAEVVILSGAVMAGVPRRLQDQVPVPLLDGISCGIYQTELMVRLGAPKPSTGSYALPGDREVVNVTESIATAFSNIDIKINI